MDSKWWLLPASLICGMVGGILGQWLVPDRQNSATFETVRVTKDLFIAPDLLTEKGCRISADGTITATGGLVANQIRGNLIAGRSLIASLNATQQTLDKQEIAVEIVASPERGGEMVLRSNNGVFCPSRGPATAGFATFIGFDGASHTPAIYTQDLKLGPPSRAFVVCAKPKPASPEQDTASQANQATPRQQPRR